MIHLLYLCLEVKSGSSSAYSSDLLVPDSTSNCLTGTQKYPFSSCKPLFWLNLVDTNSSVRKLQKASFVLLAICPLLKPVSSKPYNYCLLLLSWIVRGPRVYYGSSSMGYIKSVSGFVHLLGVLPCHRRAEN